MKIVCVGIFMRELFEGVSLCDDFLWELFEKSSHTLKSFLEILFRGMRFNIFLRIPRSPKPGPNFPVLGPFVYVEIQTKRLF